MKNLSKSVEEYTANDGWSSSLFKSHAAKLFKEPGLEFEVGRTVIYARSATKILKIYVHHNGRNREWVTFTDENGEELISFHYTDDYEIMIRIIRHELEI